MVINGKSINLSLLLAKWADNSGEQDIINTEMDSYMRLVNENELCELLTARFYSKINT